MTVDIDAIKAEVLEQWKQIVVMQNRPEGSVTATELANQLNMNPETVRTRLLAAARAGTVEMIKIGGKHYFKLFANGVLPTEHPKQPPGSP